MINLNSLIKEFYIDNIKNTDLLESQFLELSEVTLDPDNSYIYTKTSVKKIPGNYEAWSFNDRCGNELVVIYLEAIQEVKSGFRIPTKDNLIFDPLSLSDDDNKIIPCPDDKKLNTIYKIILDEIVPKYLLNKKPSKLTFNPISLSRKRIVDFIFGKINKQYPFLKRKNNWLINL
jgi:hypothetical protein